MKRVMKFSFVISALMFLFSYAVIGSSPAAAAVPQFREYSVGVYSGSVRAPNLSSHPDARTYRTRLSNAARGPVNFAGEYILASWGCGANCLMGAVINARTGRVIFLPHTVCCWDVDKDNPIDYQAGSNLIVFTGLLDEEDPMATHYYEFSGGQFRFIQRQTASAGGGGGAVTPSCPSGYVLSGGQCAPYRPAAPGPPTSTGQFDIRHGYDLPGGDYDRVNGLNNYQECQSECANSDRCNGFTFNTRHSVCFLKWRGENWTPSGNAVSGLRMTRPQTPQSSGGGFNAYVTGLGRNDIIPMRSDPSQGRNKIGVIPGAAENIWVHRCDQLGGNEWCDITYQGQRGWVIGDNLQNAEGG